MPVLATSIQFSCLVIEAMWASSETDLVTPYISWHPLFFKADLKYNKGNNNMMPTSDVLNSYHNASVYAAGLIQGVQA